MAPVDEPPARFQNRTEMQQTAEVATLAEQHRYDELVQPEGTKAPPASPAVTAKSRDTTEEDTLSAEVISLTEQHRHDELAQPEDTKAPPTPPTDTDQPEDTIEEVAIPAEVGGTVSLTKAVKVPSTINPFSIFFRINEPVPMIRTRIVRVLWRLDIQYTETGASSFRCSAGRIPFYLVFELVIVMVRFPRSYGIQYKFLRGDRNAGRQKLERIKRELEKMQRELKRIQVERERTRGSWQGPKGSWKRSNGAGKDPKGNPFVKEGTT